ncbi:MAG: hypothetical protein WC728_08455 [Elusimicrobiota bacterium]
MRAAESPARLRAAFKTPAGFDEREDRVQGVPVLTLTRGDRCIHIQVFGYLGSRFRKPEEYLASEPSRAEAGTIKVAGAKRTLYRRSVSVPGEGAVVEDSLLIPSGKSFMVLSYVSPAGLRDAAWKAFLKSFRLKKV